MYDEFDNQRKTPCRGEIYWADLLGVGHMQVGLKPIVVVSNEKCNQHSSVITYVPLTSRMTKKKLPTHVSVMCENLDGKKIESVALCECISSIDKILIHNKYGDCTEEEMREIDNSISIQLALNCCSDDGNQEQTTYIKKGGNGYGKFERSFSNTRENRNDKFQIRKRADFKKQPIQ